MKTVLLRLAGFTGLPLLSLATPFLLLPVLSRIAGAEGWSSIVAGQAVGTFGATFIAWGWNIQGTVQVARNASPQFRAELYRESIRVRLILCVIVIPLVSVIAALLAVPELRLEAIAMSWTTAVAGLSPAWFCIGVGKPGLLAVYDTIPRVVATLIATPLILVTGKIWLYAPVLLVAVAWSMISFQRRVVPEAGGTFSRWGTTGSTLKTQAGAAGISLSGNTYAATPVPVAQALVQPAAAAGFSSADTIYRFGLFSVMALGNTLQGWTLEKSDQTAKKRHAAAIWSHAGLGLVGGALLATLGPLATEILFGAQVRASAATCLFYGLSFLFISASSPFMRNLLIPFGGQRLILAWTALSALLGLGVMLVAGANQWTDGIAFGMALSEAVLFAAVLGPGLKRLHNLPSAAGETLRAGSS
ncbi:MAG: polysaccharide biosynthesis protein [Arthrobacter sp.]|jgi:hypothetical protein|nr:polysaccharide biosynthesis protein [Arthrobacter sp.]MCU1554268.1 polysaccharide biosynthesis protein [Arthrobacter sp.]